MSKKQDAEIFLRQYVDVTYSGHVGGFRQLSWFHLVQGGGMGVRRERTGMASLDAASGIRSRFPFVQGGVGGGGERGGQAKGRKDKAPNQQTVVDLSRKKPRMSEIRLVITFVPTRRYRSISSGMNRFLQGARLFIQTGPVAPSSYLLHGQPLMLGPMDLIN